MNLELCKAFQHTEYDAFVLPQIEGALHVPQALRDEQLTTALEDGGFTGAAEQLRQLTFFAQGRVRNIILIGLGKEPTRASALDDSSLAYRACQELRCTSVLTDAAHLNQELFGALCESAVLSGYRFDRYKTVPSPAGIKRACFVCAEEAAFALVLREARVLAEATLTARDLINEPPTVMTPARLAEDIIALMRDTSVRVTVYGQAQIESLGLTAFLEVAKGSLAEPKLIVMEYDGADAQSARLGLIGKGLTYDSGGYSLQSSPFMETMQHDMSGGAAVAAAVRAAAQLGLRINVTAVIAACENKLSATAYVPGDVIPSMSGRYIEINNTDAEGRVTLADAVTYLQKHHAIDRIVDIATLTDGIQTALGNRRAGLFSNDRALADAVFRAGERAAEPVWELPCDEHIRHVLDSRVAHLKNSAMGSDVGAYATVGAMFIREFVEDKPWAHLDIGGVAWTREQEYYYTKGGVGFGARLLCRLMQDFAEVSECKK